MCAHGVPLAQSLLLRDRKLRLSISASSLDILMTLSLCDALNFGFEFGFDVALESLALALLESLALALATRKAGRFEF